MTTRLAQTLYALGVVAVLLTVTTGRAATPSFDSFDTNDFRVIKTTAPWKILSNTANTTNNFTNVVVNYINSTIINTNTIITNVSSTIVNTNTTIINQGDTIINTNVTQTFSYTTNIYDNSLTIFTNVLEITTNSITIYTNVFVTNSTIFINGTNVAAINPTIGRLPYKSGTNTFDDSSMYFIDTNTTGTATLEVTDLASGGVVVSLPSGIVTNLSNGTGALTNDGAGNLGWSTIQGADLWTNNAGILEPVDLTLPLMITNQIRFGPGATNVLYRESGSGNLAYWNTGTDPKLIIYNGSTNGVELEAQGATGFLSVAGLSTTVGLRAGADQVVMTGGSLYPVTDLAESLGSQDHAWKDFWSSNVIVRGSTSSATNYTRLFVSITTNVVFDSQSSGTNGLPKQYRFAANGITLLTISTNSGWTGTGTNVFLDDGTFGPVPSTNGANMSGTLTSPYYPRASGPHTLVDGAIWEPAAGAIAIGTNSNTIFPAGAYTGMVATHDTAAGEDPELDMFFAATGDGNVHDITTSTNGSSMFWDGISGTGGESVLQLDRRWSDIDSRIGLSLVNYGTTNSSPMFQALLLGAGTGSIPDKLPMWMDPMQYGTSSGTYGDQAIYKFGTAAAETYRKLLDVSNAGTNLFSIAASGDAILHGHTPASSSETNYVGAITWDANNLYIWTATNVNKKVPLTSW